MASGESPRRSTSVTDAAHGALLRQLHHSFPQRFEGAFESLLTHFVDCMDGMHYFISRVSTLMFSFHVRGLNHRSYHLVYNF